MPFQLYFNPMNIKKINIVNGEEIDCSKETMKYVMNRYSLFDKIRSATTFMLLLLDPDWCLFIFSLNTLKKKFIN
ncbi:hypothetical protein ENU1_041940 [Entamoeba nuttalli P19]|uniref:Uncharacterized protein n=1 Tax=Entamoeba nuttalli (strain P19) TaxID=1076696 RepID=K2HG66_ENTNP|nr:hypothetical protein ENU1_041940 [Entamoeba nuttalli P19]EKE41869.1 hypothetical protein ENU1_041940 [Entamoeba nuttalli P19]|eukprot:XP_008855800.1 hypothetical protein ENU1_041940 [Entamoeba nuttalli P19]